MGTRLAPGYDANGLLKLLGDICHILFMGAYRLPEPKVDCHAGCEAAACCGKAQHAAGRHVLWGRVVSALAGRRRMGRACLLAMLMPALLFAVEGHAGSTEPVIQVIVAPDSQEAAVPLSTLRAIFGMRLHRWPDGAPVKVFVFRDDTPEHAAFSKTVLQVFPHQLRQSWDRLVFSGLAQYPEQVASEKEMLDKVASTPGAVGYIRAGSVDRNVHVLQIR